MLSEIAHLEEYFGVTVLAFQSACVSGDAYRDKRLRVLRGVLGCLESLQARRVKMDFPLSVAVGASRGGIFGRKLRGGQLDPAIVGVAGNLGFCPLPNGLRAFDQILFAAAGSRLYGE